MNHSYDLPAHIVSYFSAEILAHYSNQSDKYTVEMDYFSGEIQTCSHHYQKSRESTGQGIIFAKFGFRTRKNGDLALAVWMPDLNTSSSDELSKWKGFAVQHDSFITGPDSRFEMWCQRYIEGNWNIENGAIAKLKDLVRKLNALTVCTVGSALFKFEDLSGLCFPTAQNNQRYHDAHSEAYKLLIDGLNKDTLLALGGKLGIPLKNPGSARTLNVLKELLPESLHDSIFKPFYLLSKNRGLADHHARPAAQQMEAFEQFDADLKNVVAALGLIKHCLASTLKVTVESCVKRREAMSVAYPSFDPNQKMEPNYSIWDISKVEGKKISRVEFGLREHNPRIHNSELIILYFDDDSSMAIHMGSNVVNLCDRHKELIPDDLNVSFVLDYVPPLESTL